MGRLGAVVALPLCIYGAVWLPVVWIQHQLHAIAANALQTGQALPSRYFRLFRIWFICGFPAFFAVLAIIWLMVTKPVLA